MPSRDSSGRFVKGGVTDIDHGAKALLKRLTERARVTVGVHEDEGSEDHSGGGGTIAEVMGRHEIGLGVPRRSFIADYVDENRDELRGKLRTIGKAVIEGKVESVDQAIDRFGLLQVGEVQRRIRAGIDPPLEQATIDAKGSDTPLIDTGEGWSSVRHKVEKS